MKKLIFILGIILFCSACSDEQQPTTYQIFNSSTPVVTGLEYLDGSVYEVIVYHYSGTAIIRQDSIEEIASGGGKTPLMEVPSGTDLIKVSFKMLPPESFYYSSSWNIRLYMYDYRIIRRGINNIIGINGGTYISDTIIKANNRDNLLKEVRTLTEK